MTQTTDNNITMEIVKKIGVLHEDSKYGNLELRIIKWNGRSPKYDIRKWTKREDGSEQMSKGITLSLEEMKNLKGVLVGIQDL